jgi:1,2-phenylacetyl-CoA epoxidase PaaB subunit
MSNKIKPSNEQQFEVFGRDNTERPLSHIGSIQAPNQKLAVARAKFLYSERQWVELCVASSDAFVGCLAADQQGIIGMA